MIYFPDGYASIVLEPIQTKGVRFTVEYYQVRVSHYGTHNFSRTWTLLQFATIDKFNIEHISKDVPILRVYNYR